MGICVRRWMRAARDFIGLNYSLRRRICNAMDLDLNRCARSIAMRIRLGSRNRAGPRASGGDSTYTATRIAAAAMPIANFDKIREHPLAVGLRARRRHKDDHGKERSMRQDRRCQRQCVAALPIRSRIVRKMRFILVVVQRRVAESSRVRWKRPGATKCAPWNLRCGACGGRNTPEAFLSREGPCGFVDSRGLLARRDCSRSTVAGQRRNSTGFPTRTSMHSTRAIRQVNRGDAVRLFNDRSIAK